MPWEVHICTDPLSSVVDTWIFCSMDVMMFVEGILYLTWEVHMCTDPLSSVMDPLVIPSMDTQMFYAIAACGEALTHTHTQSMTKEGLGLLGLDPPDHICTRVVDVVSAGIVKFLHQCIYALRNHVFAKRGTCF